MIGRTMTLTPERESDQVSASDPLPLLRSAIAAPSSHNTQPWKFRVEEGRIDVFLDPTRWLTVADADRRELHLSVGAAIENLVLAAEHFGLRPDVVYFPDPADAEWVARVVLTADPHPRRPSLYPEIARRRTNRRVYRPEPLDGGELADLVSVAWDSGVWAWTSTDPIVAARVARLVARGDRIEFSDPRFRRELADLIGQGFLDLPRPIAMLARIAVARIDLGRRIARRDQALVEKAPALLGVVSSADDALTRVRAGQAVQRVWLLASRLGLAVQPMSQPLQVPQLRAELAECMGLPHRYPQLLFRIGYAARQRRVPRRRPIEEVLLA